ncbi:MAG: ferrous iron transport protein A [Spirochaetaceae bacterium]|nr:ferrous iron transport protein A [Spirochaetaceae bacterium]
MTLRDLKPGETAKVVTINAEGAFKRRIMDMGITTGVSIKLVKVAPLGDPVEVTVRGYQLSLRKEEAASLEMELI